jgi:hypothetical protein
MGTGGVRSASLTALVNPNGPDTTYRFEYGADTTYGSTTPETAVGSGFDELPATAELSGLPSGVTYHFRVVATNVHSTTTGDDGTFTTTAAPTVRGQFVTDIGTGTATIFASISPNGAETTYQFEYGLTDAYGSLAPAAPAASGRRKADRSPECA